MKPRRYKVGESIEMERAFRKIKNVGKDRGVWRCFAYEYRTMHGILTKGVRPWVKQAIKWQNLEDKYDDHSNDMEIEDHPNAGDDQPEEEQPVLNTEEILEQISKLFYDPCLVAAKEELYEVKCGLPRE